jgi:DNA polymerase delta subunit 1
LLQVLGLSQGANSEAVNRAYKRKVSEARGNDAAKARIENAHSAIMMSQLTARMKASVGLSLPLFRDPQPILVSHS